jgi:hypothetical protein
MALTLLKCGELFLLVRGHLFGAKGVCNRVVCNAASVPMCIGCALLCHSEGELCICRPQKPSGPNLLDEPLKDFIVIPACSLWKWVITIHSESVQPLQSVKLIYQPCSWSRVAFEHLRNR